MKNCLLVVYVTGYITDENNNSLIASTCDKLPCYLGVDAGCKNLTGGIKPDEEINMTRDGVFNTYTNGADIPLSRAEEWLKGYVGKRCQALFS